MRWGLATLVAALASSTAAIAARSTRTALRDLHPPRQSVEHDLAARGGFEEVTFRSADGVTLRGWYRPPRNGALILLAHGWGASRTQMLPAAAMLAGQGFGALLFDFRGHGESEGSVVTSGDQERLDLAAALAFVRRRTDATGARLGAQGFSMGGTAVAEVAAVDGGIEAAVLEATPPTLEEDIRSDYPAWRPFAPWVGVLVHRLAGVRVSEVRPIARLCALAPRPLLLIYGDRDPAFAGSTDGRRMLGAACGPADLWIVPGAGHGKFMEVDPDGYAQRISGFFTRALLANRAP